MPFIRYPQCKVNIIILLNVQVLSFLSSRLVPGGHYVVKSKDGRDGCSNGYYRFLVFEELLFIRVTSRQGLVAWLYFRR